MACMSYNLSADGVYGVGEELVGFRHDLVSDYGDSVEPSCEADETVHVVVETLLSLCEHLSADILASKVGCQGVDDDQADVVVFDDLVRLFQEKYLMVGVVGFRIDNPLRYISRLQPCCFGHSHDPFWTEGLFRIKVQSASIQPTLIDW